MDDGDGGGGKFQPIKVDNASRADKSADRDRQGRGPGVREQRRRSTLMSTRVAALWLLECDKLEVKTSGDTIELEGDK